MPAKRRRTSETESSAKATETSQKRVTRSSTRPKASAATTTKAPDTEVTIGDSRRKTTSKSTNKIAKAKDSPAPKKAQRHATQDAPTSPPTSPLQQSKAITIQPQSNTTQPIQCQLYTARQPPSTPNSTLIFTHGAGGTLAAPAVQNFCTGYSDDSTVLAFQGSMNLKSRVKSFASCVQWLEDEQVGSRKQGLVLGGRSMGARAAVMCASEVLEESECDIRLVLISYPLVGPKQDLRDQILLDLPKQVRILFVIGDRDSMCPLDILEGVRGKMKAPNGLVVVRGADHGMHVRGGKGRERRMGEETGRVASQWIDGKDVVGDDIVYIGDEGQDKGE